MRVLLLGGTEFFAPFVVDELAARRHSVAVLTRSRFDFGEGAHVIQDDASDLGAVLRAVASWEPEGVLDTLHNSAARASGIVSACKGRVKRSVHLSSAVVYGPNPVCPIDEETAVVRPEKAPPEVADQVMADEAVLAEASDGFPGVVMRLPELYGPRQPRCAEWFFAKRVLDGRTRVALPEAGLHICHRGFVQNMARGVVQALTLARAAGHLYNLGEEKLYTLAQLARGVARALDYEWDLYSVPGHLWRTPYDHTSFYDLRKARAQLRYRDRRIPRDGLELPLGWLCQSPPGEEWSWPGIEGPFDYQREDELIEDCGRKLDV